MELWDGCRIRAFVLPVFVLTVIIIMFLNIGAFPADKGFTTKGKESSGVDPNVLRSQATSDVQVAFQLVSQADSMLKNASSRDTLRAALDIYVRAGQTAERAANVFKSLQPKYASEDDVRNSQALMERCVASIQQIKKVI